MNYIINPWVFYLLDIVGKLHTFAWLALVVSIIAAIWYVLTGCDNGNAPKCVWNVSVIISIISLILIIVIPSKETRYQMLIASQVTTESVNDAKNTIKDIANYIVETAKEIKSGEES